MPLEVITGRANSGKSGPIHEAIRSACQEGRSAYLVLPSDEDTTRFMAEFAAELPVGVWIGGFGAFLSQLWMRFGDGRGLASDAVRAAAMAATMQTVRLTHVRPTEGLAATLVAISGRSAKKPVPAADDPLAAEIAQVIRAYRRQLEAFGQIEPSQAASLLAGGRPDLRGTVAVNRFTDLVSWQEELLSGLSTVNRVVVALPHEDGLPATLAVTPLIERMRPSRVVQADNSVSVGSGELQALQDGLFQGSRVIESRGDVIMAEAAGPEAEAALTARIVARLLGSGYEPETIVVAYREPSSRASLLRAAFRSEGVPADLDIRKTISRSALGRAVAVLVRGAFGEATREEMCALVTSAYMGPVSRHAHDLDVRWRQHRHESSLPMLADLAASGGWARQTVELARGASGRLGAGGSWKELAVRLASAAWEARGAHLGSAEAREDLAVIASIDGLIADLAGASEGFDAGSVLAVFRSTAVATARRERPGTVQVTSVDRLRSRRFSAVVIGGLSASEFSTQGGGRPTSRLATRLGLPDETEHSALARLLFYMAVTRARDRLVLVRQSSDEKGEAKAPSVLWEEVLDSYLVDSAPPVERLGLDRLSEAMPTLAWGRKALRGRVEDASSVPRSRHPRVLDREAVAALEQRSDFTVTELETYLECPYRWFHRYVLRPKQIDRGFDAAEAGQLSHQLLAAFYEAWRAGGHPRVTTDTLAAALDTFDSTVTTESAASRSRLRGLPERIAWETAIARSRRTIVDDAVLLPGLQPIVAELRFGDDEAIRVGGVDLRGSVDRVDAGDRVLVVTDYKSGDVSMLGHGRFKSSGRLQVPLYAMVGEALFGRPVAGGVYRSLATGEMAGFWDAELLPAPERLTGASVLKPGAREEMIEDTEELVAMAVEGIRTGAIEPRSTAKGCAYCDVRSACGVSE